MMVINSVKVVKLPSGKEALLLNGATVVELSIHYASLESFELAESMAAYIQHGIESTSRQAS